MSSSHPQKLPGLDQDLPKLFHIAISIYTEKQFTQLIISNTADAQTLTDLVNSIIPLTLSSCVPDCTDYMNAPLLQGKLKHLDRNYPTRRERKHFIKLKPNAVFADAGKKNLVLIITLVIINVHIVSDPAYYIYFLCSLYPHQIYERPLLRGKYFHSKITAAFSKLGAQLNFKSSDDFCEFGDKTRSFDTSYYAIFFNSKPVTLETLYSHILQKTYRFFINK